MKLNVARGFKAGTRINSISVPKELRVKHSTGIDWFDRALGGKGFTPTTTMMLTGVSGGGKSTLLRQLASSMTKRGAVVVYNCGEESLFQAKMACERLGLDGDFMVAEETMVPKLLAFMDEVKKANPGRLIVLLQDSLQTLDDGKYVDADGNSRGTTSRTPQACAEMLVDWAQRSFAVCVFVGQVTKSGDFQGKNGIKHAIDVHGHLYHDTAKKSDTYGCLLFEVPKNRWGASGLTQVMRLGEKGLSADEEFSKANLGRGDEEDEAA